jgi:hypothetical protein
LSAGGPWVAATLILLALIAVLVSPAAKHTGLTRPFQFIAIVLFPLLFPLLQIGNSSMPRYYLLAAIAILLLSTDVLAAAFARRLTRVAGVIIFAALVAACLHENIEQAALKRGDPGAAIEAMKRRSPSGATVFVDHIRPTAVLRVAASSAAYPLALRSECPATRFVYVELDRLATVPLTTVRCDKQYKLLIAGKAGRLSGTDWALYDIADPVRG